MSTRAAKPIAGLVLGGEPRANLLPPEVAERSKAMRTRGFLVFLVVLALVAVGAGYGYATFRSISAQLALGAAQARTTALLEERALYGETIALAGAVKVIGDTQVAATSTEVIWSEAFDQITAQLPPTYYIKWTGLSTPPWLSPLSPVGPLRSDRIATFQATIAGPGPFDMTALYRRILQIEGVADMSIDLVERPEGKTDYEATITVNISPEGASDRWSEDEESTDEGE